MPSRLEGGEPAEKEKKKDGRMEGGEGRDKAFTFWVAGKQRRWGLGRRDWCPWTWRSSGGPQGSCCWCRLCRRCWAWQPSLRLSSASDLLSPGPSAGSDLKADINRSVSPDMRTRWIWECGSNPLVFVSVFTQKNQYEELLSVEVMLTLCNLQLSLGISKRREEVQFDPGLCTQAVLQVLSLVLHGWQRWHQHLCVFFILFIFMKLLRDGGEQIQLGSKDWTL